MLKFPRRWKGAIYFFILASAFFALAYSGQRSASPAWYQRAVLRVLSPAVLGLRSAGAYFQSRFGDLFRLGEIRRENERLKAELDRSVASESALREELHRISLLFNLRESPPSSDGPAIMARVIGYDPSQSRRSLWIDKGSRDGLELDQAVVADRGLVGRIFKLGPRSAQVLLLTDSHSSVDVLAQRSRARGTLTGHKKQMTLGREQWLTQAEYISAQEEIHPGDLMLTSGLDGVFPAGLPVGTVSEVQKDASGLFLTAQVAPQVELLKLEAVRVVPSRSAESPGELQGALGATP